MSYSYLHAQQSRFQKHDAWQGCNILVFKKRKIYSNTKSVPLMTAFQANGSTWLISGCCPDKQLSININHHASSLECRVSVDIDTQHKRLAILPKSIRALQKSHDLTLQQIPSMKNAACHAPKESRRNSHSLKSQIIGKYKPTYSRIWTCQVSCPLISRSIKVLLYHCIWFMKYAHVCMLHSKHQVLDEFKEHVVLVDNQTELPVRMMCTDNGVELRFLLFDQYLEGTGIKRLPTPYTYW